MVSWLVFLAWVRCAKRVSDGLAATFRRRIALFMSLQTSKAFVVRSFS